MYFASAYSAKAELIETLDYWMVYDDEIFVPFIETEHRYFKKRYIVVEPAKYPDAFLHIEANQNSYIFFDNKLFAQIPPLSNLINISCREIMKRFGNTKVVLLVQLAEGEDKHFCTSAYHTLPVSSYQSQLSIKEQAVTISKIPEKRLNKNNLFLIGFVIFLYFSVINATKNPFLNTFSLIRYIRFVTHVRSEIKRVDIITILLFISIYASTLTYLCLFVEKAHTETWVQFKFLLDMANPDIVLHYFYLFLLITLFLVIRIALIYFLSFLHSDRQIAQAHIHELTYIGAIFAGLFLVIGLFANSTLLAKNIYQYQRLDILVVTLLLAQAAFIIFRVNRLVPLKKIYLISYFCGAELLPTIVFIKFYLK
jgi:hypothetical protein